MKKILLTVAVAAMALTASAQVYVGGEIGAWRNTDANKTTFAIQPEVGYQLSDKWDLGIGIGYAHAYQNKIAVNSFEVDPYARWSFVKFGPVSLFLDMGFGINTYKAKVKDGPSGDSNTAWRVGVAPGLRVNLTKHIDFIAHMGFLGYRDADDSYVESPYGENGFGFNVSGNDLTFGINYNF